MQSSAIIPLHLARSKRSILQQALHSSRQQIEGAFVPIQSKQTPHHHRNHSIERGKVLTKALLSIYTNSQVVASVGGTEIETVFGVEESQEGGGFDVVEEAQARLR